LFLPVLPLTWQSEPGGSQKPKGALAKIIFKNNLFIALTARKHFNILGWLVRRGTHIPSRYEQTIRYYSC
jgi:hypothetical protein